MKYYHIGIISSIAYFGVGLIASASISEVDCKSSSYFSSTCTQCFTQSTELYQGTYIANMSDTWYTHLSASRIYLDENPPSTIVKIKEFYKDNELFFSGEDFLYSDTLNDGNLANGEFGTDGSGRKYIDFPANASGKILVADPKYYIELKTISDALQKAGKIPPLFEFSYNLEFYNLPDLTKKLHHQECILYYPAWCGDGVINDTETCDFAITSGKAGYSSTCSKTCTNDAKTCERGSVNSILTGEITASTAGLCKDGIMVNDFTAITADDTTSYTWSCGGSSIGGACEASYTKPAPVVKKSCTKGSVVLPLSDTITKNSIGLCASGENVGDFAETSTATEINYTWSCNGSLADCQATYTLPVVVEKKSCVKGNITLPLTGKITLKTTGLCAQGQSVGDFTEKSSAIETTYTWSCNGSLADCQATYTLPIVVEKKSCTKGDLVLPLTQILTKDSNGLCAQGQKVGNFRSNKVDETFFYMWSCNGSLSGGECSTSYTPEKMEVTPKKESCIRGDISLPLTSEITSSTEGLCGEGEEVNNFRFTISGSTRYYVWSCGTSLIGGSCSADYTAKIEEEMVKATKIATGPESLLYFLILLSLLGGYILISRQKKQ